MRPLPVVTVVEFVGGGILDGQERRYGGMPPPEVRVPALPFDAIAAVAREMYEHPDAEIEVLCMVYEYIPSCGEPGHGCKNVYLYRGYEATRALT